MEVQERSWGAYEVASQVVSGVVLHNLLCDVSMPHVLFPFPSSSTSCSVIFLRTRCVVDSCRVGAERTSHGIPKVHPRSQSRDRRTACAYSSP